MEGPEWGPQKVLGGHKGFQNEKTQTNRWEKKETKIEKIKKRKKK